MAREEKWQGSRPGTPEHRTDVTSRLMESGPLLQRTCCKPWILSGNRDWNSSGYKSVFMLLLCTRAQIKWKTLFLPSQRSLAPWRVQTQAQPCGGERCKIVNFYIIRARDNLRGQLLQCFPHLPQSPTSYQSAESLSQTLAP